MIANNANNRLERSMDSLAGLLTESSANKGNSITKKFTVGEAAKVEFIGPGSGKITRGAAGILVVTATPADFEHLEIKAAGDSVKVEFHGGILRNRNPEGEMHYELTVPTLEELKISDRLVVDASSLDSRELKVELKGGCTLTMSDLRATELEAKLEGESLLTVTGAVTEQKIRLAGKSTYVGVGVSSEETEIHAADESVATVRVNARLKVSASGASVVSYTGKDVDLSVQTGGKSVFQHQGS